MDLISVHVPKTAGVTFRTLLQAVYGQSAVRLDYGDRVLDPTSPFQTDPASWRAGTRREIGSIPGGVRVIHGHFGAAKYADVFPEARRIVWLREPVARLVSHYHYWRELPPTGHSLHRRVLDERLSLLEFARLAPMRNVVANVFLRGVPLDGFAFVGVQERFAAGLERLAALLGWPPVGEVGAENRHPRSDYQAQSLHAAAREEIAALNAEDVELYQRACRQAL